MEKIEAIIQAAQARRREGSTDWRRRRRNHDHGRSTDTGVRKGIPRPIAATSIRWTCGPRSKLELVVGDAQLERIVNVIVVCGKDREHRRRQDLYFVHRKRAVRIAQRRSGGRGNFKCCLRREQHRESNTESNDVVPGLLVWFVKRSRRINPS